jgi:hypothetical protein
MKQAKPAKTLSVEVKAPKEVKEAKAPKMPKEAKEVKAPKVEAVKEVKALPVEVKAVAVEPKEIVANLAKAKIRALLDSEGCNATVNKQIRQLTTDAIKKYLSELSKARKVAGSEDKDYLEKNKAAWSLYSEKVAALKKNKIKFSRDVVIMVVAFMKKFLADLTGDILALCDENNTVVKRTFLYDEILESKWYYPYLLKTDFRQDKDEWNKEQLLEECKQEAYAFALESLANSSLFADLDIKKQDSLKKKIKKFQVAEVVEAVTPVAELSKDEYTNAFTPFIKNCFRKRRLESLDAQKFMVGKDYKQYVAGLAEQLIAQLSRSVCILLDSTPSKNVSIDMMKRIMNIQIDEYFTGDAVTLEQVGEFDQEELKKLKAAHTGTKAELDLSKCPKHLVWSSTKTLDFASSNVDSLKLNMSE